MNPLRDRAAPAPRARPVGRSMSVVAIGVEIRRAATGVDRCAARVCRRRLEEQRVGDQRHLLGDAEHQRPARPHPDADIGMSAAELVEQRLDDPQLAPRAEPVLDAGQQRPARHDQHRAAQQRGRRADSDELRGAHGAQQEERAGQHDQHDADGEHEQRPATSACGWSAAPRPTTPASARAARRAAAAATTARRRPSPGCGAGTPLAPSPAAGRRRRTPPASRRR